MTENEEKRREEKRREEKRRDETRRVKQESLSSLNPALWRKLNVKESETKKRCKIICELMVDYNIQPQMESYNRWNRLNWSNNRIH